MSALGSPSPLFLASAAAADTAANITKSVRLNSGDSAHLTRTPSSSGNRKTWTWSGWVKRSTVATSDQGIFGSTNGATFLRFKSNQLDFVVNGATHKRTSQVFRDTSSWYHFVWAVDTTQATASDRSRFYVNGVEVTDWGTDNAITQNTDTGVNNAVVHVIGATDVVPNDKLDAYLADFYLIDGSQLEPTSFGAFDDNGVWQAAAYSGSFGTNGFHLFDFANESGIGDDSSGNDNDFTVNNLQADGLFVNQGFTNPGNAFDGNTGTYAEVTTSAALGQFIFPGGISVSSSVKIKYSSATSGNVYLNGSATALAGTGAQEHNITFSGTLNTIGIQSTSKPVIYYVDIDNNGTYLTGGAAEDQDVLRDVPTNGDSSNDTGAGGEVSGNYATLNPNITGTYISRSTLSNGNLQFVNTQYSTLPSTIAMSSGKWYCEGTLDALASASNQVWAGLLRADAPNNAYEYFQGNNPTRGVHFWGDNTGLNRAQSYGASYATAGTVIGIAFDADAGSCTWYINGSSQGASTYNIVQGEEYYFSFGAYVNGAWTVNFGQRAFAYSAPSGYKALCTTNLPTPTIADGSDYFDAKLWTGNGSTQTISGLEFSPDLVWIKSRSGAYSHLLFDQIRGTTKYLRSDNSGAEGTDSNSLTAFTSDGFSVGTTNAVNQNSGSLVAWAWDAGSSTVSNTDGSITSSVRANPTAGFSIVTYTGSSSGSTVGHGLNAAPEFIIGKRRDGTSEWSCYHKSLGNDKAIILNTTAAAGSSSTWNSTTPSSSVVTLGSAHSVNFSSYTHVLYCFAPVAGYSAFGSYTGNGSNDGPFIYTGFKPAFLMLKRTDGTAAWYMYDYKRDGYNAANKLLYANYSNAEANNSIPDLLSNGFKLRSLGTVANGNGNDYIYMAFAENPFQANGGLAR